MRETLRFAALMLLVLAVSGALLALLFRSPAERQALVVSAGVALVVQLFAFVIARAVGPAKALTGFTIGTMLRLVTLIVYGVAVLRVVELPAVAALIGLATFFFLSTILETRLLKT